jgi:hypothetical protein
MVFQAALAPQVRKAHRALKAGQVFRDAPVQSDLLVRKVLRATPVLRVPLVLLARKASPD